jgi:hypothetical protein
MGKVENVGHPLDGAAVGVRISHHVMRRDGRRLIADDVHHDGAVCAGHFSGWRGVPQAVKREGVHGAAAEDFGRHVSGRGRTETLCSAAQY